MTAFAQRTKVPCARTRQEIDRLLRAWKCDGIQWTDEFTLSRVTLRFVWSRFQGPREARVSVTYQAQFRINLSRSTTQGRQEHRLLLLWLKAALNAVEGGIIPAELLFLPWLVGRDGQTFGEIALPRLPQLLNAPDASTLLLNHESAPAQEQ